MPVEDVSEFYGSVRTIAGEVGKVYGPAAFLLVEEADDVSGQDPEGLLVINVTEQAPAPEVEVGHVATVSGRVEGFSFEEARRETGVDLNEEVLAGREDEPSIYATMVDADDSAGGTT